jgi:hypothetical protein
MSDLVDASFLQVVSPNHSLITLDHFITSCLGKSRGYLSLTSLLMQSRAMSTSADSLVAFGQQHVTKGLGRLTEAVMAKGEGSYVTFEDGRRMLDFSSGIGVTNLGELLRAPS